MATDKILSMIVSTVITAVIIPIITIAGKKLIAWLETKTSSKAAADFLQTATGIVVNAVRFVYQTYVESLKDDGRFGEDEQKEAYNRARDIVLQQTNDDVKRYIESTYGEFETWIDIQIESTIERLKGE